MKIKEKSKAHDELLLSTVTTATAHGAVSECICRSFITSEVRKVEEKTGYPQKTEEVLSLFKQ